MATIRLTPEPPVLWKLKRFRTHAVPTHRIGPQRIHHPTRPIDDFSRRRELFPLRNQHRVQRRREPIRLARFSLQEKNREVETHEEDERE